MTNEDAITILGYERIAALRKKKTGAAEALWMAMRALKHNDAQDHLKAVLKTEHVFMEYMERQVGSCQEWLAEHGYESDEPFEASLRASIAAAEFLETQVGAGGEDPAIWIASRERDQGMLDGHLEEIARGEE